MSAFRLLLATFCSLTITDAGYDIAFDSDDDLSRYITRPEIKAPLFEVEIYEPDQVTPGHWFVAPYANILQERHAGRYYQACQSGPAIYDGNGWVDRPCSRHNDLELTKFLQELIWSGACLIANQNTCDFKVFNANSSAFLSAILTHYHSVDSVGHAIILDDSLQVVQTVDTPKSLPPFNMHEFNVIDDGKTALHIVQRTELADITHLSDVPNDDDTGLVVNMGIREFDLSTGQDRFMWWTNDQINLNASGFAPRNLKGPWPNGWDYIHLNAIDKDSHGDYLVTARYTDAVYKISGPDGHIMWSLGGTTSSFRLDGFNFSRPHDARFLSRNGTSERITLLDNGGCEESKTSDMSSALIIHLDTSSEDWIATVEKRWSRPDGGRSTKRGNFQLLPNGNAFVGWSENSYISEHSPDGRVLMEAQFTSDRFVTYRAYKFNFTSAPVELPILKGFAYGESPERSVSVYYVSWNGATEVATWEFYSEDHLMIGKTPRSGFETAFQQISRYVGSVYARAVDARGTTLAESLVEAVEIPHGWASRDSTMEQDREKTIVDDDTKTEL